MTIFKSNRVVTIYAITTFTFSTNNTYYIMFISSTLYDTDVWLAALGNTSQQWSDPDNTPVWLAALDNTSQQWSDPDNTPVWLAALDNTIQQWSDPDNTPVWLAALDNTRQQWSDPDNTHMSQSHCFISSCDVLCPDHCCLTQSAQLPHPDHSPMHA